MTTLWSRAELQELCPWEQVQAMARRARGARLGQRQGGEAGEHALGAGESACLLCLSWNCASTRSSASGAVVCCQCTDQIASGPGQDLMCEALSAGRPRLDDSALMEWPLTPTVN